MLDGISPEGLSEWTRLAGWVMGSAVVLLMLAVAGGVVLALWGKTWFSPGAIKRGWAMVALAGLGGAVLASSAAATQWGADRGTASLMPPGARPQAVSVEKQAPKQTCNRQAVRDFAKEDPSPDRAERERIVRTLLGGEPAMDGYTWGQESSDMATERVVIASVKWYAAGAVSGEGEPDCSAENVSTPQCSPVEVNIARQSMNSGAQTGRTLTLTRGENCS